MPAYDDKRYSPAAPLARVIVRSLDSGAVVEGVNMLLDSGADISCLPRAVVEVLGLRVGDRSYEVMAYDNSVRECATVRAEVEFLRGHFKGLFVVLEQDIGVRTIPLSGRRAPADASRYALKEPMPNEENALTKVYA
jgi:hypothetical protein